MIVATVLSCVAMALLQGATPVILDTDLGDDIDDTWALAMAIGRPELDVKLVTVASDNTPDKARIVAKILTALGRTDIPIGIGPKNSDRPLHQMEWLGDYQLSDYGGIIHEDGVAALIDAIHAADGVIPLMVIGPQTNIAAALKRDATIANEARIVAMAGSVYIGYNGKDTPDAEWNVFRDIPSAQAVFAASWPIAIAPLDSCGTLTVEGERYDAVATSTNPLAKVVIDNYTLWTNRPKYGDHASSVLFDTLAIYLTYDDALCEMKEEKLVVDNKGFTRPDPKGRPVMCAVGWKDKEAFQQHLVDTLIEKR